MATAGAVPSDQPSVYRPMAEEFLQRQGVQPHQLADSRTLTAVLRALDLHFLLPRTSLRREIERMAGSVKQPARRSCRSQPGPVAVEA